MDDLEKRKRKLLRLSSVENWARHNWRRVDDIILALSTFDRNPPQFGLGAVKMLCARLAMGRVSYNEALDAAEAIKHPAVRSAASQIVPVFQEYLTRKPVEALQAFENFRLTYPIGPRPGGGTLFIPIVPTFVGLRDERLVPVFIIPWANLALGGYQKTLISSILKDGLLSHQQFIDCDGEILAFPKMEDEEVRYERSWSIRDYASLDREDLSQQFSVFGRALSKLLDDIEMERG